jgi:hypothetical protein
VEVPSGYVPVADRVRRQFRGDERDRLVGARGVGVAPVVHAVRDETAGQSGTAWGGSELHGELLYGRDALWHMPVWGSH